MMRLYAAGDVVPEICPGINYISRGHFHLMDTDCLIIRANFIYSFLYGNELNTPTDQQIRTIIQ